MKKLLAVALCAALMLVGVGALADYPEKPVECMVQWLRAAGRTLRSVRLPKCSQICQWTAACDQERPGGIRSDGLCGI